MSNIDKQALRETAEKALPAMQRLLMMPNDELFDEVALNVDGDVDAANAFNLLAGPETMLALLDELEAADALNKHLELAIRKAEGCSEVLRRKAEAAEKRNVEQQRSLDHRKFLLLSADEVQRDFAETLGCAGDNESIMEAMDDLKQHIAELESKNGNLRTIAHEQNELAIRANLDSINDAVEMDRLHKRIAELERSETQLINERDNAESALNDAYKAVMGQAPEWSNWFSFENAIDEIELACELWRNQTDDVIQFRQRIQELEAKLETADRLQDGAFRDGLKAGFSYGQTDDQSGFAQCMSAYSTRAGIKVKES